MQSKRYDYFDLLQALYLLLKAYITLLCNRITMGDIVQSRSRSVG